MLNIVIPAAGAGSRFTKLGYQNPKPFIDINGRSMLSRVVENIGIPGAKYIFLFQKKHLEIFGPSFIEEIKRRSFIKDFEIISTESLTQGAVSTALLSKPFIDNENELLIVNSDQLLEDGEILRGVRYFEGRKVDGGIICFF